MTQKFYRDHFLRLKLIGVWSRSPWELKWISLYAPAVLSIRSCCSLARRLQAAAVYNERVAHDASADPFGPALPTDDVTGKRCCSCARARLRGAHSAAVLASLIASGRRSCRANVTDAGPDLSSQLHSVAKHLGRHS